MFFRPNERKDRKTQNSLKSRIVMRDLTCSNKCNSSVISEKNVQLKRLQSVLVHQYKNIVKRFSDKMFLFTYL